MFQIQPKNIIPITEARARLDDLVLGAQGENFFVISKQGRAKAAIIDIEYLMDIQKKLNLAELRNTNLKFQKGLREYLIKRGYSPDKMSEEEAEKIIQKISKNQ